METSDPTPDPVAPARADRAAAGAVTPAVTALSPSRANDFKSCPLKYRFRVIDRLPEPPSEAAARGTLVHAALESMFGVSPEGRTVDFVGSVLPDLWTDMVRRRPELADLVPESAHEQWFAAARSLLRRYFDLEDPTRFSPRQCEVRVEVAIGDGIPTRGFIDRIDVSPDGLWRIVDYKTGCSPAPAYADEAMFQLKFYALMLYRLHGVVAARLRLLYLGDGRVVEHTPDEGSLLAFEETVGRLWDAIQRAAATGDFRPRPSRLCDWCHFKPLCPAFGGTAPPYPGPAAAPSAKSG